MNPPKHKRYQKRPHSNSYFPAVPPSAMFGYSEFKDLEKSPFTEMFKTPKSVINFDKSPNCYSQNSKLIEKLLITEFKLVESPTDEEKKKDALLKLNDILKTWMDRVNKELDAREPNAHPALKDKKGIVYKKKYTARLLCYGSYKLGVSTPTGDIDALVLSPSYIDRDRDFFGTLYKILQEKAKDNSEITDLTYVNYVHTITPLIKMEFYDVSVDLVFARLPDVSALDGRILKSGLSDRPKLYDNDLLKQMDEKQRRSYNGFRNAEMILNSIADPAKDSQKSIIDKIARYRTFLRCIKLWAKRRGLNENKFGFLGGIALAILSAKIFQMFPLYAPIHLVERFFYVFGYEWNWDQWHVRIVDPIVEKHYKDNNFKNMKQRFMYIMTPAWPQMNSAYNVSFSTREMLLQSMRSAHSRLEKEMRICSSQHQSFDFVEYYKPAEFFQIHEHFLEISIVGNDDEEFLLWKGFVEAKLRYLTEELETLMNYYDFDIQVWPRGYSVEESRLSTEYNQSLQKFTRVQKMYIGLSLNSDYQQPIKLDSAIKNFLMRIEHSWNKENEARDPDRLNLFIYLISRDDISFPESRGGSIERSPNLEPKMAKFRKHQKALVSSASALDTPRTPRHRSGLKNKLKDNSMGNLINALASHKNVENEGQNTSIYIEGGNTRMGRDSGLRNSDRVLEGLLRAVPINLKIGENVDSENHYLDPTQKLQNNMLKLESSEKNSGKALIEKIGTLERSGGVINPNRVSTSALESSYSRTGNLSKRDNETAMVSQLNTTDPRLKLKKIKTEPEKKAAPSGRKDSEEGLGDDIFDQLFG